MKNPDFVRPDSSSKERSSRFRRLTTGTLALSLALAFVVGACDAYAQAGGSGGNGGDLTLSVAATADGAEVSIPFDVTLESNVALGPPESGNRWTTAYRHGETTLARLGRSQRRSR